MTEGDSFSVCFQSVQSAVQFCLEVQYRLLDTPWPPAILKLPACKVVTNAHGDVIHKVGCEWEPNGCYKYCGCCKYRMGGSHRRGLLCVHPVNDGRVSSDRCMHSPGCRARMCAWVCTM